MSHAGADISHDNLSADDLASSVGMLSLLVGGAGLVASVILGLIGDQSGEGFFRAYLTAFMFCLTITLGALFFVLLQHITRAGWSVVVRRLAENITGSFPVLAVLALPIVLPLLFGWPEAIQSVYPWKDPAFMEHNHIAWKNDTYFARPFFLVRMIAYFAFWTWAANYFRGTSIAQDTERDEERVAWMTSMMQRRSTWCMLLFALTLTFCAFDLLMSLDPRFFSTIFGVYTFAGSCVAIFSTLVIIMFWLQSKGRMQRALSTEHFHDVGKLVFAFVIFWAYIAFSQYMLIWYASLPEETPWYYVRQSGAWLFVSFVLLFCHFCAPFLYLISRYQKRNRTTVLAGAIWVLAMHWFDIFWLVFPHASGPAHLEGPPSAHYVPVAEYHGVMDTLRCATCLVGVGGIWLWGVARCFKQARLVPEHDPRLHESLAFENV